MSLVRTQALLQELGADARGIIVIPVMSFPFSPATSITAMESLREHNLGGFFVDFNATKHTGSRFVEMTILSGDGRVRR